MTADSRAYSPESPRRSAENQNPTYPPHARVSNNNKRSRLEASISTPFGILSVMDEFTIDDRSALGIGEEFDVELSASLLDDDESWETMFSGNPERRKALEHIDGWSYRAFGEVVSIGPVVVDCGMIQIPEVFHSNDARIVGEFVSFTITRLDATQYTTQAEHVVGGNGG